MQKCWHWSYTNIVLFTLVRKILFFARVPSLLSKFKRIFASSGKSLGKSCHEILKRKNLEMTKFYDMWLRRFWAQKTLGFPKIYFPLWSFKLRLCWTETYSVEMIFNTLSFTNDTLLGFRYFAKIFFAEIKCAMERKRGQTKDTWDTFL